MVIHHHALCHCDAIAPAGLFGKGNVGDFGTAGRPVAASISGRMPHKVSHPHSQSEPIGRALRTSFNCTTRTPAMRTGYATLHIFLIAALGSALLALSVSADPSDLSDASASAEPTGAHLQLR